MGFSKAFFFGALRNSNVSSVKNKKPNLIYECIQRRHEIGDSWKKIFKAAPAQILVDLRKATIEFYETNSRGKNYEP